MTPELLERADAHAAQWTGGNRSRLIADALERVLAEHAAHLAAERRAQQEANPWPSRTHTPDTMTERASRPITADLGDL